MEHDRPIKVIQVDLSGNPVQQILSVGGGGARTVQVSGVLSTVNTRTEVRDSVPRVFEDTSFVSGDSPVTLDVNAALLRNATEFSVQNDGPGNFTVAISNDGTAFGDEKTVFDRV